MFLLLDELLDANVQQAPFLVIDLVARLDDRSMANVSSIYRTSWFASSTHRASDAKEALAPAAPTDGKHSLGTNSRFDTGEAPPPLFRYSRHMGVSKTTIIIPLTM
jgi:hypothetical protein